jgi:hypothetical protein
MCHKNGINSTGRQRVADQLLKFLKTDSTAGGWLVRQ